MHFLNIIGTEIYSLYHFLGSPLVYILFFFQYFHDIKDKRLLITASLFAATELYIMIY